MSNLTSTFARGMIAGATGTAAINLTTYVDMLVRGRPPSQVPEKVAGRLADDAGIESLASSSEDEASMHRRSAAGALMGYVVGIGSGVDYAVVRSVAPRLPVPVAAVALGLAAMATSDITAVKTGVTDPREWSKADWASDLLPHLVYGVVTAAAFEALNNGDSHY